MLIISLSLPNCIPISYQPEQISLQHNNTRTKQACTKVYDGPNMKTRLLTIKKHPADTRTRLLICGVDKALSGGLIRLRGLCAVAPSATQLTDGSLKNQRTHSHPSPAILKIHGTSSDT